MEIIRYQEIFNNQISLSVTIGAFDGIHQGHINILRKLSYEGLKTAVISFAIHPDYSLNKRVDQGYVMTLEEKIKIFEEYKIDYLILLEPEILKMEYSDFNNLLKQIGVKRVVVGSEFRYGHNGKGSCETLKEDFLLVSIATSKENKMSSETMRTLLQEGKVEELMAKGYPQYTVSGVVEHGKALGTKLGFPTANLSIANKYTGIKKGVYQVSVVFEGKEYPGVCNIGTNPSIDHLVSPRLEVHIIGLNEDLYNKNITVKFQKFMRNEMKFSNIEALKTQINKDIQTVKNNNV